MRWLSLSEMHLTRMQKRVILLKVVVGGMLAYAHFFPEHAHFTLFTNLLWLVAF